MKRIFLALSLLLTFNSHALTSTPEIDAKYSKFDCGLLKDNFTIIDTNSNDICYNDTFTRLNALVMPELTLNSVALEGTEFKEFYKEVAGYNASQINATNSTITSSGQYFFNRLTSFFIIILAATVTVLTLKNFGELKYREYSIIREIGFKMLGFLLLIPTSSGPLGVYIAGELYFYSKMQNNLLSRSVIADLFNENYKTTPNIKNSIDEINFSYESAVKPVNTMLYARTALSQTGKFYNQFINKDKDSGELTSNLNEDIKMNSDSIVFNRTILGINYYDAGNITLLPTSTIFNPFVKSFIVEDKDQLITAVENTQNYILENTENRVITSNDINDIVNVLNVSYNNAYKKIIKDIWVNDIHELHVKTLEKQCFNSGIGTYSKSYVKKLNGTLPASEDEGLIFCVEQVNGEYVALGADAKIEDITGSSKKYADINKENTEYVIKRKREIVIDKLIPLQAAYLKAYSAISNSTTENKMIKDFAANPSLYAPIAEVSIKKLGYNKNNSIKMFLENGLNGSNNNANSNMILESAKLAKTEYTIISDNLADLKLSSAVLDINAENMNIKTLGINTKNKTLEQNITEGDSDGITQKIYGSFLNTFKQYVIDAGITTECNKTAECIANKQDSYIGTLTGFGQSLKDSSYIYITGVVGIIAVKQTLGYMKGKSADKKNKVGSVGEDKKKSKLSGLIKKFFSLGYFITVIVAAISVPIYFVGMFLANILPLMISLPFFIMSISYELMMIAILKLGIPLFILFRLFNVNDDNNTKDIFYKMAIFPMVIFFVPTLIFMLSVIYKSIIFWLFYILISQIIIPFAGNGLVEFILAMCMIVYIVIFILVASLMMAINIISMAYEIFGFDKIFTLNITQYAEEINNIFLKVIPFSHTLSNLIFSKGLLSNNRKG